MKRPNLLILHTDQQRWDALGAAGNGDIRTPNLDRLAARGINYLHHYSQCPVCMPSRASLMTGRYCSTLGVTDNGIPVPDDTVTLAHLLKPYGYVCGQIGKMHFQNHANRDHRRPYPAYGFDHVEVSDEPGCYEDAYRAWVRRKAPEALDRISVGLPPATVKWQDVMHLDDGIAHPAERFPKRPIAFGAPSDLTHTAFVAEQTMEFLAAHAGRPWMCFAGFYSPHSPWVAPQEFIDLYEASSLSIPAFPPEVDARRSADHFSDDELRRARHGYYAMVSEVDHHVGRILARLDDLGLADETVILFTSDHGEWLGEHLLYGKGYPGHDAVSRVPLVIRRPGDAGGRTVTRLVESIDILPTLLDWAGIQPPPSLQGQRLPVADDDPTVEVRASALSEQTGWRTIRSERHRYVLKADGHEELYDLAADPAGYHNVAGDAAYADVLSAHRKALARRLTGLEQPLPRPWTY